MAALMHAGAASQEARPGDVFADPDMPPRTQATCGNLRELARHASDTEGRIDKSIVGEITAVHSDGALVYLAFCTAPNPRVLCITYQDNGMKTGDRVIATGGYQRQDPDHILLDPCLAHRP
jgi:hypothetical protein